MICLHLIQLPLHLPFQNNYNSIALLSGGLDALAGASQEKKRGRKPKES